VSRFLQSDIWEEYEALEERWLAYVHYEDGRRLCGVHIFTPDDLHEYWRRRINRAGGSTIRDLRWVESLQMPSLPLGEPRPIHLKDGEPLFPQLLDRQAKVGVESWLGLAWTDPQGRRCQVVDDVMTQTRQAGLPRVYRTIVIEKEKDGGVVDMEMSRHDEIKIRINEIGRELEGSLAGADFRWPTD
jgi:hypothetical protein